MLTGGVIRCSQFVLPLNRGISCLTTEVTFFPEQSAVNRKNKSFLNYVMQDVNMHRMSHNYSLVFLSYYYCFSCR